MDISVEIGGLKDILREMEKLGAREMLRMTNNALRAGAREIQAQAKANAKRVDNPETPNSIAENIVVRSMPRRKIRRLGGDAGVRVGILGGAKKPDNSSEKSPNKGGDTYYWRFVEFGFTHKSGRLVPPAPFMRPAIDQSQQRAVTAFFKRYAEEFDKQMRKKNG